MVKLSTFLGPIILITSLSLLFSLAGCVKRTWDYVALGDSYPAGYGVERSYVDYFAEYIRTDLGVQVKIHNFARTGLTTAGLLDQVYTDEALRKAIRDAEVITIWIGWNDFRDPLLRHYAGTCGGNQNLDCFQKASEKFNENINALLDEILTLASPQDTLIRIADAGIPLSFMNEWKQQGRFEKLKKSCFEIWRGSLVETAYQHDITVVYTYQVLNGPSGDENMRGIYQSDGIHFNDKGQRLIAELHREGGYEYAP